MNNSLTTPQNIDAERSVLGAILIDNNIIIIALEFLPVSAYFHFIPHKYIYDAMVLLYNENIPIDLVTLSSKLRELNVLDKIGGSNFIVEIMESVVTSANVNFYIQLIIEASKQRQLINISNEMQSASYEGNNTSEIIQRAEQQLLNLQLNRNREGFCNLRELFSRTIHETERRRNQEHNLTGLSTGLIDLDQITNGFQKSDLIILAARPSQGKTALSLQIARYIAGQNPDLATIFFSLEMSSNQLSLRLLSSESEINSNKLRNGRLIQSEWGQIIESSEILSNLSLYLDDSTNISVSEIRNQCKRILVNRQISLIVIDYLQLIKGEKSQSRQEEVAKISRSLKNLAKELDIPILALCQLSRAIEYRHPALPQLSDLRESGGIEADADVVIFIFRPELSDPGTSEYGTARLLVAKQRSGPIGEIRLVFRKEITRFYDLARES